MTQHKLASLILNYAAGTQSWYHAALFRQYAA